MKPYPAYKDSGVAWIGKVPERWEVVRLKWIIKDKLKYGANESTELTDTTLPRYIRITDFDESGNLRKETFKSMDWEIAKEYLLEEGDILFARSGATVGKTFQFKNYEGVACFAGYLIKASPDEMLISSDFLYYYTKSNIYENWKNSIFIQATIQNIGADKYQNLEIPLPPIEEQTTIATYLDHKTAQIDTLIDQKRRLIDLLAKKRAAVISRAVTKGLSGLNIDWRSLEDCANLPGYKDSGVAWIGKVPEGWAVVPLKFVAEIQTGLTLGNKYDGIKTVIRPYLRVANVQDGYLNLETITTVELPPAKVAQYELRFGDVLMTEGGDFDKLGRGYIWEGQIEGCLHQNHVFAVRPNSKVIRSRFIAALTTSFHGKNYFISTSQQTTNLATINQTKLGQFLLLLPPIKEQDEILNYLDHKTAQIDQTIIHTKRQIDLLQEYRTALISAAVTGKIDVRGVNETGETGAVLKTAPV